MHKVRLLYLGQVEYSKPPRLRHSWYVLEGPGLEPVVNDGSNLKQEEDRHRVYAKVRPYGCRPGMSFTFDEDDQSTVIYIGSAKEVQAWNNDEDVAKWDLKHRAADQSVKQVSLVKKLETQSGFGQLVKPLRVIYHKLSFAQQSLFLVLLVNEIRKPNVREKYENRDL